MDDATVQREFLSEEPSEGDVDDPDLSSGAYAAGLIQRQTRRLGKLQPEVLADNDPEPLHQLRVTLRRLRTAIGQFAPALVLPEAVTDRRIARVARRTGLTRDLDVLRDRLESSLLPALPEHEHDALRPLLKRLKRHRRLAFEQLAEALCGSAYLKLLARLRQWQLQPVLTPLGQLPLRPRLFEWQAPASADLFLHGGWFSADPQDPALHDLRKRIKGVRYALEHLEPFAGDAVGAWIKRLKQAQDDLGDLHDLQVLGDALAEQLRQALPAVLPALHGEIERQKSERWRQWQELSSALSSDDARRDLHSCLLEASH